MPSTVFVAATAAALLAGCGAGSGGGAESAGPEGSPFDYLVRVEPGLETLVVRACFADAPPASLVCGRSAAAAALREAVAHPPGGGDVPLVREGERVAIPPDLPAGTCVDYRIDLALAAGSSFFSGARLGDAVLVGAAAWLWRPAGAATGAVGTLRFDLPEGIDAAVPFPRVGDRYALPSSAFHYLAHTVFGRFDRRDVEVPGGVLDVVELPGMQRASHDDVTRWLTRTGAMVAMLQGRFPEERALVVVVPIGDGTGVAFGNVGRGGGASVMLIVEGGSTYDDLVGEWVPPHEMAHLALPYVSREDAWLSEGTATYYQEVLRARGGVRTPLEAWRAIDDGFRRGAADGSGRTFAEESVHMFETRAFQRVYWGGTALALLADVELRKNGGSLDAAMRDVDERCSEPTRTWSAVELAAELDRSARTDVFARLIARWANSTEFPDVSDTFAWLGLSRGTDGELVMVDAEGAAIRDAIMEPR